ncbi:MAG: hypothetical protein L0Y66_26835 [Myxococcaceae bacterium]|nr:hypothetical protein [Myxococcaceae bacterium]MCI0672442.1 hypothetical protein [Myxococcaceae bacterium]
MGSTPVSQTPPPADETVPPADETVHRYRVLDNGTRCITYPCPSYDAVPLDGGEPEQVHEVDLSALGLSAAERDAAMKALYTGGLVVRARIVTKPKAGPAGDARVVQVVALEGVKR